MGLCVAGQRVGVIKGDALIYWDVTNGATAGPFGSGGTGLDPGELGGTIKAIQNTWTGHVTLVKTIADTAAMINFFPSVIEEIEDISAMGSPGQAEFQWEADEDGNYDPGFSDESDWVRDWSWRTESAWELNLLEGRSSLAAAMWSLLVDVPAQDTARWGCGLPEKWFDISSFEALHARCVAGWRFANKRKVLEEGSVLPQTYRYAERYKLDLVLDVVLGANEVLVGQMLAACNGHRYLNNGRLSVGISLPGHLPLWHFTDHNLAEGTMRVSHTSRAGVVNRVRVQYKEVRDHYGTEFAEANDEFDRNKMGRVAEVTATLLGVGRKGQAELLASQVLRHAMANRRGFDFTTHYLGYVITPGDPIEITHAPTALARVPARQRVHRTGGPVHPHRRRGARACLG